MHAKKKITLKDIENLNKLEREHLGQAATKILKHLEGEERDRFLDKIEQIIPADTRSDIWEYNHSVISSAISNYMHQHGEMPTKSAIANATGYQPAMTVAKPFNDYKTNPRIYGYMGAI